MTLLMRATEVMKRPVVTLHGDDIAQVKDIVFEGTGGSVGGFTLAGRGLLAGPMREALPWAAVHALGPHAVMIADETVLQDREAVIAAAQARESDVMGSRVITDDGIDLGPVSDVILEVGDVADVIGYEVDSTEALGRDNKRVLIPLPDVLAVSGEALIVPAAATEFVSDDLAGFGAAVHEFRERLASGSGES
jgi:sporulation protein YlmC with PRC-barrel domain